MSDTTESIIEDRRESEPRGRAGIDRPKGRSLKPLRMLWPYVGKHKKTVFAALIFLLISSAASLTVPMLFGQAIDAGRGDDLQASELLSLIDEYFLYVFLAAVAMGVFGSLRFYFVSRFGERIAADLRQDLYAHMLSLSPRYHAKIRSGEAVSRLTADITLIENFLGSSMSFATRTTINTVGALSLMLYTNWQLGGLLLIMIPVAILPVLAVGRVIRKMSNRAQTNLSEAGGEAAEALDSVELVQAYGREHSRLRNFASAVEATFQAAMRRNGARAVMIVMVSVLLFGGVVAILWLGARAVATNNMSPGELTQMVLYALYAGSGFGMLAEVFGEVMRAAGAADRASEVLSETPEIAAPANPVAMPVPIEGHLVFDNISFGYGTDEAPALSEFSLDVAPGEFVALVGPSGAGKTTVFRLALRLFDPETGEIRLDGVEARKADPRGWRSRFAYAPQESALFSGTARDNIAFGGQEQNDDALIDAAKRAEAWNFLESRGGLDAPLGIKGRDLSGGQRQRVALARALVRDAPILLLDEATSALDSESEALVQKAVAAAAEGRTTLVIAHRLSTVRRADRIVVMDAGRIVEQGSHDELIRAGGLYARLAELQFASEMA